MTRLSTLLLLGLFWTASARADKLTIYHLGVGQGDATLIVATQAGPASTTVTTTILIDAGNSTGKGEAVATELEAIMGANKTLDLVIVSHLHSDHMGGMATALNKLNSDGFAIRYLIDRGAAAMLKIDDECYTDETGADVANDPVQPVSLPTSQVYAIYTKMAKGFESNRLNVNPGTELFASLKRPSSIKMTCVASNAAVLNAFGKPESTGYSPHDENDYSFAFLLEFEGFRYFTGGDIGGGGGGHGDGETPLAKYFNTFPDTAAFHFCSFKVSHHGSRYSTNPVFLKRARPTSVVIPSALRSFSGTQIPTAETITNLLQYCASGQVYPTYVAANISSGAVSNYIDVNLEVENPGYGKPIVVSVRKTVRSKTAPYSKTTETETSSFTCSKTHSAPTAMDVEDTAAQPMLWPGSAGTTAAAPGSPPTLRTQQASRKRKADKMIEKRVGTGSKRIKIKTKTKGAAGKAFVPDNQAVTQ